uniref:Large ribosomal subunit protein mL53 n=1 Tax=Cyprinus carpio carpio TaxID=630221 RepID=A0A8C0YPS0_CYPCA
MCTTHTIPVRCCCDSVAAILRYSSQMQRGGETDPSSAVCHGICSSARVPTATKQCKEFLIVVGSEKARATNMNCEVITEVKHDRSEPTIDITFLDGERLLMKGSKLTTQELLSALQTRCSAKDPQAKAGDKK